MKLLCVSPTVRFGGTEKYVLIIARAAKARGWDVSVLLSPRRLENGPELADQLRSEGIGVLVAAIDEGGDRDRNQKVRFARTARLLLTHRPDLVHVNVPWPNRCFGVMVACSMLRVPAVATHHLIPRPQKLHERRAGRLRRAMDHGLVMSAISKYTQTVLADSLSVPASRVEMIYDGVEQPTLPDEATRQKIRAELRQEFSLEADTPLLLTVARLVPQKGFERLIQAAAHLCRERPDVRLMWVGDGMLREPLKEKARAVGIEDQIIFAGERMDVPRFLLGSDLFVFPTLYEGFGLSLVEAMAHALPVVSTAASNIPELITHGEHGLLCRVDDSADLLETLRTAMADPQRMRRLSDNARHRASAFTEQRMIDQTLEQLQRVAASRGRAKVAAL